jgi:hypothetical protein
MSGMGKPGDEETYIYDVDIDAWKASPGGGTGGADNFSTSAIITRMSGSVNSRIDRLDYVRLSGSISGVIIWGHDLTSYDSINVETTVLSFANSSGSNQERFVRQTLEGSFFRITGSTTTVGITPTMKAGFGNFAPLSASFNMSGSSVQLAIAQEGGITDWSSDTIIKRLITTVTSDAGPAPSPTDVSSLWSWQRADQGLYQTSGSTSTPVSSSGHPIARWEDLSGNNRHLQVSDTNFRPTWNPSKVSFNSKPCLVFDGNDRLITPTSLTNPMTIFIVVEVNVASATTRWIAGTSVNWMMGLQGATTIQYYGGGSFAGSGPVISATTPVIHMVNQPGAESSHTINGVLVSGTTTGTAVGVWSVSDNLYGQHLTGAVAEVIVYNKTLTTDERKLVEKYLGNRYGISVP